MTRTEAVIEPGGIILGIVLGIIANKITPIADLLLTFLREAWKNPAPLQATQMQDTKREIKRLKEELEQVTLFSKSLPDLYLYALGEIAFGLLSLLLASLIGIFLGVGYLLSQPTLTEFGENPDHVQIVGGVAILGATFLVARSSLRLVSIARTVRQVRGYEIYKSKTEARIAYLEQRLNDFYNA